MGREVRIIHHRETHYPEDYQTLRQQVLSDMQQPDFEATWNLLTAWGRKTPKRTKAVPAPEV